MNMPKHRIEFLCPIADVDVDKFRSAVDSLIEKIRIASPIIETD